ncbi:MAG: hypothetical protein H6842_04620 [Rhodospirillaceae bacterium]|nr:hypothetical protein [Rhodospirillaceae bacterium]
MLKADAKREIQEEFRQWRLQKYGHEDKIWTVDALKFFTYLQKEKNHLLDFRGGHHDKWQDVASFLTEAGLIGDVRPSGRIS